MPRISERSQALQDIDAALEIAACEYALSPLMDESTPDESTPIQGYIQDLILMHDIISSTRYLFKGLKGSAGRHAGDSLEAYIHEYPDTSFLHLFRMHRVSFWQLVQLLTQEGGNAYWCQANADIPRTGQPTRPIYQQIAIALYVLGGGMTGQKSRMLMNIGYGSIWTYT